MVSEVKAGLERRSRSPSRLFVADPRGLCAGVVRSLNAYEAAIATNPDQVLYSLGQPAHNTHINQRFKDAKVEFVNSLDEIPKDGKPKKVVKGPHGTEESQKQQIEELSRMEGAEITVWDTTCPLVTKVEDEIIDYTQKGIVTIYWGDPNHQEAKSTISYGDVILVRSLEEALSDEVFEKTKGKNGVAFASQTTFNADEATLMEEHLKEQRYPNLITPQTPDRCYATRNRQKAVKEMINLGATFMVIVGSPDSSNSRRLYEIALEDNGKRKKEGKLEIEACFVDSAEEFNPDVLKEHEIVGFESGASVEEEVFQEVVNKAKVRFSIEKTEEVQVADEKKINFAPVKRIKYEPQFIWQSNLSST